MNNPPFDRLEFQCKCAICAYFARGRNKANDVQTAILAASGIRDNRITHDVVYDLSNSSWSKELIDENLPSQIRNIVYLFYSGLVKISGKCVLIIKKNRKQASETGYVFA